MSDSTAEVTVSLGDLIEMETNLRKLEAEVKELKEQVKVHENEIDHQEELKNAR